LHQDELFAVGADLCIDVVDDACEFVDCEAVSDQKLVFGQLVQISAIKVLMALLESDRKQV
jgi:hypothetical protein